MKFILHLHKVDADGTISVPATGNTASGTGIAFAISINGVSVYASSFLTGSEAAINADTSLISVGTGLSAQLTSATFSGSECTLEGFVYQATDEPYQTFSMRVLLQYYTSGVLVSEECTIDLKLHQYNQEIDLYVREVGSPLTPTVHVQQHPISNTFIYNLTTGIPNAEFYVYDNENNLVSTGSSAYLSSSIPSFTFTASDINNSADVEFNSPEQSGALPQLALAIESLSVVVPTEFTAIAEQDIQCKVNMDFSNFLTFAYEGGTIIHAIGDIECVYKLFRSNGTLLETSSAVPFGDISAEVTFDDTPTIHTFTLPDATTDYFVQANLSFYSVGGNLIFTTSLVKSVSVSDSFMIVRENNVFTIYNTKSVDCTLVIKELQIDETFEIVNEEVTIAAGESYEYTALNDGVFQFVFVADSLTYYRYQINDYTIQTCVLNAAKSLIMYKPCCAECAEKVVNYRFNFSSLKTLCDTYFSTLNIIDLDASTQVIDTTLQSTLVDIKLLMDEILLYCEDCASPTNDCC